MFWRWLAVFGPIVAGLAIVIILNFWHLSLASQKEFLGIQFSSYWAFLAFYVIIFSPLLALANYFFFSAYYLGTQYKDVFQDKYWVINLSNSLAGILVFLFLTWLCFTEVPSKGTLAGLFLSIAAVLVSIFWK